jgi:hypothetical protein
MDFRAIPESSTTSMIWKGQFRLICGTETSRIQGVTPLSGTDIDGTRGDASRPPPYPASEQTSVRPIVEGSKAKYLAGLDGLDLEMAFGIGLQLDIGLVVVDEESHSADVLHSFGSLLVDLDVGATDAPAEWWGRWQHQEETERVGGVSIAPFHPSARPGGFQFGRIGSSMGVGAAWVMWVRMWVLCCMLLHLV